MKLVIEDHRTGEVREFELRFPVKLMDSAATAAGEAAAKAGKILSEVLAEKLRGKDGRSAGSGCGAGTGSGKHRCEDRPSGSASGRTNGPEPGVRESFIKTIEREIREDIAAVRQRDPAARGTAEVVLLYSGFHAILAYRIAHRLYLGKHYFSARAVSQAARFFTGIEIHPGAEIGNGLFIDHGMGVVIGETTVIGDNCTLYQGVTLGGTGKDVGKRHPTLGDNVMVGAGAKVLGPIKIGDNVKIAAGAVVLKEIPDCSTAVGIPAKVVRRRGVRVGEGAEKVIDSELDHLHDPDPVAQQMAELEAKIEKLSAEVDRLSAAGNDKKTEEED